MATKLVLQFINPGMEYSGIFLCLEVVSKCQVRFKGKASRELKAERTRSTWAFQLVGQRSPWA